MLWPSQTCREGLSYAHSLLFSLLVFQRSPPTPSPNLCWLSAKGPTEKFTGGCPESFLCVLYRKRKDLGFTHSIYISLWLYLLTLHLSVASFNRTPLSLKLRFLVHKAASVLAILMYGEYGCRVSALIKFANFEAPYPFVSGV